MSDLIERLKGAKWREQEDVVEDAREAADEIERLLGNLAADAAYMDRLLAALEGVLDYCQWPHGLGDPGRLAAIHSITCKALEGSDE